MTVNTAVAVVKPGKTSKTVEVWTNDPGNRMVMLSFTGEIIPPEKQSPE